jgi:hypothetical protein
MNRLSTITLVTLSAALLACGGLLGDNEAETPSTASAEGTEDGAVEAPADYEGPIPADQTFAGRTAAVEVCTIEGVKFESDSTMSVFASIAVDGDRLLVATGDGKLHALRISHDDGCVLSPDPDFGEGG